MLYLHPAVNRIKTFILSDYESTSEFNSLRIHYLLLYSTRIKTSGYKHSLVLIVVTRLYYKLATLLLRVMLVKNNSQSTYNLSVSMSLLISHEIDGLKS